MARAKYIYVVYEYEEVIGYFTVKHEAIAYAVQFGADKIEAYPDGGHDVFYEVREIKIPNTEIYYV